VTSKVKYLLAFFVLISIALLSVSAYAEEAGEHKSCCPNPIKDTIDQTASIKNMQSKPAEGLSYTHNILGKKIPTQTDNCGNID